MAERESMSDAEIARKRAKALEDSLPWVSRDGELPEDEWKTADEIAWLRRLAEAANENAELRAQVTRCQEENTREVERRRKVQDDFRQMAEENKDIIEKMITVSNERDELKARLEALGKTPTSR